MDSVPGAVPDKGWELSSVCPSSQTFTRCPAKAQRSWRAGGSRAMAISRRARLRLGAVNVSKPGQDVCGDAWGSVRNNGDDRHYRRRRLGTRDGSQNGVHAKLSGSCMKIPKCPPRRCWRGSIRPYAVRRGAAVAIASIDSTRGKLTYAGVGNISARIYAGVREPAESGVAQRNRRTSMRANPGVQLFLAGRRAADSSFRWPFHRHRVWSPIRALRRAIPRSSPPFSIETSAAAGMTLQL